MGRIAYPVAQLHIQEQMSTLTYMRSSEKIGMDVMDHPSIVPVLKVS